MLQKGFAHIGLLLVMVMVPAVLVGVAIQYNNDPNIRTRPEAADPNLILHENWQTTTFSHGKTQATQLYNEFDQAPTGEIKTWTRSLSIDGCFAQSKVVDGTCAVKNGQKDPAYYGPLLNNDGAGIDIIDYEGRKVLRHWIKQDTWHSHGARLNLVYDFLRPYANRRIYARYQMMFPTELPVVNFQAGGLWTSVGVEMKAHGWNTNATIQHNYNQKNQINVASPFVNVSTEPFTIEANKWYQMDIVWDMYSDSRGRWEAYVDGKKFGEGSGQMAQPDGFGLWIFNLYGNMFRNQERGEMYIGDVTLSTQPIGANTTPNPTPTAVATATPQAPVATPVVTPRPTPTPAVSPSPYATPIAATNTGGLKWYSNLNSRESVISPTVGTGGSVASSLTFTPGFEGSGLTCDANFENVGFSNTNINKSRGRVEFWVKPNWNKDDRIQHNFFGDNAGAFSFSKASDNSLLFYITQNGQAPAVEKVAASDYTLLSGVWTQLAIEWDENARDEMKIYVNGVMPKHQDNSVNLQASAIPLGNDMVICDSGPRNTNATIDELKIYNAPIGTVAQVDPIPTPRPVASATPISNNNGIPTNAFRGIYYNNKDYTDQKFVRTDTAINFTWGWASPDLTKISPDTYSVRWDGIWDFEGGNYEFSTYTDDGMVIMIDGEVVFNQWKDQHKRYTFTKQLSAGKHYIKVGYYENSGYSTANLNWKKI